MSLVEQIQKDITTAMKAREEQRLSTLRMVKSALKNREVDKMAPLDEKESQAVLATLIKQRNRVPASAAVDTNLNKFPYEMIDPAVVIDESEKWEGLWSELFLRGKALKRDSD